MHPTFRRIKQPTRWSALFAIAIAVGCSGGDGADPGDDEDRDASVEETASDEAACEALCEVEARCADADDDCVDDCVVRPELPSDICRAAHRARNECVGALDCAGYEQWSNPSSGDGRRPCADEEISIVDACAS